MSRSPEEVRNAIFASMREQWDIPVYNESDIAPVRLGATSWRSQIYVVRLTKDANDDLQEAVVKIMKKSTAEQSLKDDEKTSRLFLYFNREIAIWRKVGTHPNVSGVLGIMKQYQKSPLPAVVYPYFAEGDLRRLVERKKDLDFSTRLSLLRDTANGLAYLHSMSPSVVHRDVRASNVLIKKVDNKLVACLSDFGSAKFLDPRGIDTTYTTTMTSLAWTPPEYVENGKLSYKYATTHGDMWSYGCTVVEVMTGMDPWYSDDDVFTSLSKNERPEIPEHDLITRSVASILDRCWVLPPDGRPSAPAIVAFLEMILK